MNYMEKLGTLLRSEEVFPGENTGIVQATRTPGCDINEHLPTLIEYGSEVSTITEMGVRYGFSTRAFLYARPRSLLSIDLCEWGSREHAGLDPKPGNYWYEFYKDAYKDYVDFQLQIGNTVKIDPIKETDLLFIDTFHHKDVLEIELEKHGNQAQKYLIFHDTKTFGEKGQSDSGLFFVDHPTTDESGTGLWYAINPFLTRNPHWHIHKVFEHNNGLTVLERNG